jgi:hypothetical protein
VLVADNRFQIWGGVDISVIWLSFAQQKYFFPNVKMINAGIVVVNSKVVGLGPDRVYLNTWGK